MQSIMEPIYEYLYGGIPQQTLTEQQVEYNAELNDKLLSTLLIGVISTRFTQGVEQAFHYLHNPNRVFHASLDKSLLFQYYYLLSVIQFERGDSEHLDQAINQTNMYYDPSLLGDDWISRYYLLRAFSFCSKEKEEVFNLISKWLIENSHKSLIPMYSLCIYFGSHAVHKEKYDHARYFLDKSLHLAETVTQKCIALSNHGALAYALDDFSSAVRYYQLALEAVRNEKKNDVQLEKFYEIMDENLKNMEIIEAARRHEFLYPSHIRLQESDIEHAKRMRNIAMDYVIDEIFDESLLSRHGFRSSNNLYEANRYFNRAERSYELLGHVSGKSGLIEDQLKHFHIAGKSLNHQLLQRIALEQAVLINHDKAIQGILRDKIPFESPQDIHDFCDWLFSCGDNRITRLGRTHCIGFLADYLPEEHVPLAYAELCSVLNQEWSFSKDFDYKRSAMKALGLLFSRVQEHQKIELVKMLWEVVQTDSPLVKSEAVETLSGLRGWAEYPTEMLNDFTNQLMTYLRKHSKESMDYSPLLGLLLQLSQYADDVLRHDATIYLQNKWQEGHTELVRVFLYDKLAAFSDEETKQKAISTVMNKIEREIGEETTRYISMGGIKWGAMLAYLLPTVSETPSIFQDAWELLNKYIEASNVSASKRADALKAIYYLLRNCSELPMNLERVRHTCLKCLDEPKTWIKQDRDLFSIEENLLTEAFKVLSQLNMEKKDAEKLINRFLVATLTTRSSLDESLIAMTEWGRKWNAVPSIYAPILSRLYMECKNEDEYVRAAAVYGLTELAVEQSSDNILWQYASHAMELCVNDPYRIVRYNLAHAARKLMVRSLDEDKQARVAHILEILQSDLSFIVRGRASGNEVQR